MFAERTWVLDHSSLDAIAPVSEAVRDLAGPTLGQEGAGDVALALVEAAPMSSVMAMVPAEARSASKFANSRRPWW